MRRIALMATTAGLVTLGGGWYALSAVGKDQPSAAQVAVAKTPLVAPSPVEDEAVSLPPLPTGGSRAKAVQPVAGASSTPGAETAAEPALSTGDDAKPTHAASSAVRGKHPASGGGNAVDQAVALGNGVALPPLEAPEAVKQIIEAGNGIARTPYIWGGGHGKWQDTGYDCSGSVSFALAAAGLLNAPLASGPLMSWGEAGPGKWVTIYANAGHVFLEVAGIRFDTSATRVTGSRWSNDGRSTAGFVARHPAGL
jgi:cell wall-associated NlpC family hydrolase